MTDHSYDHGIVVCVLFYEKLKQTIECLQSFLPSGVPICILNNSSSASSRKTLEEFSLPHRQVTILDSSRNLGVGGGRNYLICHTKENWLLFVDNDITVRTSDWIEKLLRDMVAFPDMEVFVPSLYECHTGHYVNQRSFTISDGRMVCDPAAEKYVRNIFSGGASLVSRRLFERLGLYDESLFCGYEDWDLCLRAYFTKAPVKARLIEDVEFVQDHRKVRCFKDIQAVLRRYDKRILKKSRNDVMKRYDIMIEDSWKVWCLNQVKDFVGAKNPVYWFYGVGHFIWNQISFVQQQMTRIKRKIRSFLQ